MAGEINLGGGFSLAFRGMEREAEVFGKKKIDARGLSFREYSLLDAKTREDCFFSANVSNAKLLSAMQDYIGRAMRGESGFHREDFLKKCRTLLGVPESQDKGGITEITSSVRLRLIFDHATATMNGRLEYLRNLEREEFFPVLEFTRIESRRIHRPWRERWAAKGGKFYNGRMLAPVRSPIWEAISEFGTPYPPFAFNSGMGWRRIAVREAQELGVIPKTPVERGKGQKTVKETGGEEKPEKTAIPRRETGVPAPFAPKISVPAPEPLRVPVPAAPERGVPAVFDGETYTPPKIDGKGAQTREKQREILIEMEKGLRRRLGDKLAKTPENTIVNVGEAGREGAELWRRSVRDDFRRGDVKDVDPKSWIPRRNRRARYAVFEEITPQTSTIPATKSGNELRERFSAFALDKGMRLDNFKISAFVLSNPEKVILTRAGQFLLGRKFGERWKWLSSQVVKDAAAAVIYFSAL